MTENEISKVIVPNAPNDKTVQRISLRLCALARALKNLNIFVPLHKK